MRQASGKTALILIYLTAGISLLIIILSTAGFLLPRVVQEVVIPEMAEKAGIELASCDVRRIGLFGADLENIRLGPSSRPGITIAALAVDYNPMDLFHRTIERIRFTGLNITCDIRSGAVTIPGLIPTGQGQHQARHPSSRSGSGFLVEKTAVSSGTISFNTAERTIRLPFHLDAVPVGTGMDTLMCRARLRPFGQDVKLTAEIDLAGGSSGLNMDAASFQLDAAGVLSKRLGGPMASGVADINIQAEIGLLPFTLNSFSLDAKIRESDISYAGVRAVSMGGMKGHPLTPMNISVTRQSGNPWRFRVSDLNLSSPIPVSVKKISGKVERQAGGIAGSGEMVAALRPFSRPRGPVNVMSPFHFACDAAFKWPAGGSWSFEVKHRPTPEKAEQKKQLSLKAGDVAITAAAPEFHITARKKEKGIESDVSLSITGLSAHSDMGAWGIQTLTAEGAVLLPQGMPPQIQLSCASKDAVISLDGVRGRLPAITLSGRIEGEGGDGMRFDGIVDLAGAGATFSTPGLQLEQVAASLPLSWPKGAGQKTGAFSIGRIRSGGVDLGTVSARLRQNGLTLHVDGAYRSRVIPDFTVDFSGQSRMMTEQGGALVLDMDYESRPYSTPAPLNLGRFTSAADGYTLDGGLGVSGRFSFAKRELNLSLHAGIQEGRLENRKADLTIENINGRLFFPHLPSLETRPKQSLQFGAASLGTLSVREGNIEFQVVSDDTLFIENAGFEWCRGHVNTHALRISRNLNDIGAVLYCDRVNLAMLLEQFGAADAEGNGSVNGRIPIRYNNGHLTFQDGFLYSTPGQGGRIRLRHTEKLLAGVPEDSPQYMQMDLAREALKSYDYDWATLGLETDGTDLMMRLSFNGRPTDPLPFVYQKDIGGFARIEGGKQGSVFQGVNIDINFRLPLNDLLKYRDVFNMMRQG